MDQAFVHIQANYYDELVNYIQDEMSSYLEDGFVLVDIQYFNMENDSCHVDAFLLFNKCKAALHETQTL